MSFFSKKTPQRKSLDAFKESASMMRVDESIDRITGGTLANCHSIGGGARLMDRNTMLMGGASSLSATANLARL